MLKHPNSAFHAPRPALAACLLGAVERDTRGCLLDDLSRLNYYPATPFVTLSFVFSGSLRLMGDIETVDKALRSGSHAGPLVSEGGALSQLLLSGPQRRPTVSWSPDPVHSLMVGIYPEAAAQWFGQPISTWLDRTVPLEEVAPEPLLQACQAVLSAVGAPFERLQDSLAPLWTTPTLAHPSLLLSDWLRRLGTRAVHAGLGRSLRQWQRRMHDWTGQSRRDLQLLVRLEDAFIQRFAKTSAEPENLAELAAAAGFSDQSHMGREVRRNTGFSPLRFSERMESDEAFWFYRLMAGCHSQTAHLAPHGRAG